MSSAADAIGSGFHRRIAIYPFPHVVVAGLEDNLHRFEMRLSHRGDVIGDVQAHATRYPWTTCPGAPGHLNDQAAGRTFDAFLSLDIRQHCTHLFELAMLCAAHAKDSDSTQFDLHVDDWHENRTRIRLLENGELRRDLRMEGTVIQGPGDWRGHDLMRFPEWRLALDGHAREQAMLVHRALYVSFGRATPVVPRATDRGPAVIGVCYTYQPSRVGEAVQIPHSRREFSELIGPPLQDFDPRALAAAEPRSGI